MSERLREVQRIALGFMEKHGLHGWSFKFDNAKERYGYCSHARRIISVSRYHAASSSIESIVDTILHEVAHALNWIRYREHGHGPTWKSICIQIGAKPQRCGSDDFEVEAKYTGICRDCGHYSRRHRALDKYQRASVERGGVTHRHIPCKLAGKPNRGAIDWYLTKELRDAAQEVKRGDETETD